MPKVLTDEECGNYDYSRVSLGCSQTEAGSARVDAVAEVQWENPEAKTRGR